MGKPQQWVALLVTPRPPRFARHAPPPRISAKIESHLRFVGQAEGVCLAGTSQAAAQQGATLSVVDSEFLAYETATLVSGYAYNLTGLARGQGGSAATPHSSGASFARVDGAVIRY